MGWAIIDQYLPQTHGAISTPPTNSDVGSGGLHPEQYPTSPGGEASVRAEGAASANSITHIRIGAKIRTLGPIPSMSRWRSIDDGGSAPIAPRYGSNSPTWKAKYGTTLGFLTYGDWHWKASSGWDTRWGTLVCCDGSSCHVLCLSVQECGDWGAQDHGTYSVALGEGCLRSRPLS